MTGVSVFASRVDLNGFLQLVGYQPTVAYQSPSIGHSKFPSFDRLPLAPADSIVGRRSAV